MNILDEDTKAMLDAGRTAVLDGGYLVMTPETLKQAVQTAVITTVELSSDAISEQATAEKANSSCINRGFRCHFCGKVNKWGTEYAVTIEGGYASDHDMESATLEVCAGCLEKMLAAVN